MSLLDWRDIVDEAFDLGASVIQFIGGEPTLHPHFRTLVNHVAERQPAVLEVYTNATRLSDDLVGCLKASGASIATSFYADDPVIHDAITMRPGSWKRTVAGIERALAADLDVRVGVVEMERNSNHIPQTLAFLRDLGINQIGVDRERGVGRGRKACADLSQEDFSQLCGRCGSGRLCVTADAEIYPCVFARRTPLGDARAGLTQVLAAPLLHDFRALMDLEEAGRRETACDPYLPCGPQSCAPTDPTCAPQRACSPDNTCSPHFQEHPI